MDASLAIRKRGIDGSWVRRKEETTSKIGRKKLNLTFYNTRA